MSSVWQLPTNSTHYKGSQIIKQKKSSGNKHEMKTFKKFGPLMENDLYNELLTLVNYIFCNNVY